MPHLQWEYGLSCIAMRGGCLAIFELAISFLSCHAALLLKHGFPSALTHRALKWSRLHQSDTKRSENPCLRVHPLVCESSMGPIGHVHGAPTLVSNDMALC